MNSGEERFEIAAKLRDASESAEWNIIAALVDICGINFNFGGNVTLWRSTMTRLADLIDPTCVYEPTETLTRWDENDNEHETNEPDPDCATFACSRCGYEMLYGDEMGWFDTEPPYAPHFKFCPNCSARVLPLKLYDKVVTDDGE